MKQHFFALLSFALGTGMLFAGEPEPVFSNDVVQAVKDVVIVLQKHGLPFDARKACDAAVDAVIQVADPQGQLMSDADIRRMTEEDKGIRYEAGIRVSLTNKMFVLSEVREGSGADKAGPVDQVVKAHFQRLQKRFTGNAVFPGRPLEKHHELVVLQAVEAAQALLLAELPAVVRKFRSLFTVHARGIASGFNRALGHVAPFPLEEKLHLFPPADAASWTYVSSHSILSFQFGN